MVELSRGVEANVAARQMLEEDEGSSSALVDEEISKVDITTTMLEEDGVALEVEEDLVGRIMTSRKEIVMLRSISSRIGRCWRRSTSTVSRN